MRRTSQLLVSEEGLEAARAQRNSYAVGQAVAVEGGWGGRCSAQALGSADPPGASEPVQSGEYL